MKIFQYKTEQLLPVDISKAWDFFSSPGNLAVITPPALDFTILSDIEDKQIYTGMIIDYKVKPLFGISVNWQTEITDVEKPFSFTDRQLKGPYKLWEHHHWFIEKANGVLVMDHVCYQLPFGVIGTISHSLIVRKKLDHIFNFRRSTLTRLFGEIR